MPNKQYDVFISYAAEDGEKVAGPLASGLARLGIVTWFDQDERTRHDEILKSIDSGLSYSNSGAVVASPSYFAKTWTRRELGGLLALKIPIFVIRHHMTQEELVEHSPILAGFAAIDTNGSSIADIAQHIAHKIREARKPANEEILGPLQRDVLLYPREYEEIGNALDQWQGNKFIGQFVLQARCCADRINQEIPHDNFNTWERREYIIYSLLESACATVYAIADTNQEPSTIQPDSPWASLREAIKQTNAACADLMNHYGPQRDTLAQQMGLTEVFQNDGMLNWLSERMYYCLLNVDAKLNANTSGSSAHNG